MKTIKIELALSLTEKMIDKYHNGTISKCPLCKEFINNSIMNPCTDCFNRIEDDEVYGCLNMDTYPHHRDMQYTRLQYWQKVREYLTGIIDSSKYTNNYIPVQTLRSKCNEIDQKML